MIPKSRVETRNFLKLVFSCFTVETLAIFDQYPRKYITHLYLRRKEFWRQHVTFQTHNNLLTAMTISFLQYRGWSAHYNTAAMKANQISYKRPSNKNLSYRKRVDVPKIQLLQSFVPLGLITGQPQKEPMIWTPGNSLYTPSEKPLKSWSFLFNGQIRSLREVSRCSAFAENRVGKPRDETVTLLAWYRNAKGLKVERIASKV